MVKVPVEVSAASDLKKLAPCTPSKVSASSPEPAPSTVLIAVSISAAVWSAVAPVSYTHLRAHETDS